MAESDWLAEGFEKNRTRLRAVAYRMLGSLAEADDAVQEAWLRLRHGDLAVLVAVLDPDVVLRSDGGTAHPEISVVLHGAAAVVDHGLRVHQASALLRPALVNGAAGMVATLGGQPVTVIGFTVSGGKIAEIDVIADPDRLLGLDLAVLGD